MADVLGNINVGVMGTMGLGGIIAQKTICEIKTVTGCPDGSVSKGTKIPLKVTVKNNRNFPFMCLVVVNDVAGETSTPVAQNKGIIGGMLQVLGKNEVEIEVDVDTSDFSLGEHKLVIYVRASIIGIRGILQDSKECSSFTIT